jgi:hypothetical protein
MIRLGDIAHGRSGDKGNHANIGIIAYTAAGRDFLDRELTAEKVSAFFRSVGPERVERHALPKLNAFNFVLRNALGGGASESLRTDTQGKAFATALLEMRLPDPENLAAMLPLEAMLPPGAVPPPGPDGPGTAGHGA